MQFVSNATTSPDAVTASGTGVITSDFSVDPDSLAFTVAAGAVSEPQTLILTNSGSSVGTFSITTTVTPPGARRRP